MACGELGLNIEYFYNLEPRQFYNIQVGIENKRDAKYKQQLILTRRLYHAILLPHLEDRDALESDLWPLSFIPGEIKPDITLQDIEDVKKRWEERDAKIANIQA